MAFGHHLFLFDESLKRDCTKKSEMLSQHFTLFFIT